MGLLVRLGRMFGKPDRTMETPSSPINERWGTASARTNGHSSGGESSTAVAEPDQNDGPDVTVHSVRPGSGGGGSGDENGETRLSTPRNRQEMLDELTRNYREVVSLVRKVDTHLDEQRERSDALLTIARRIDEALPVLTEAPRALKDSIDTLREETTRAIRESGKDQTTRLDRVHQSMEVVAEEVVKSGDAQGKLIHTMAEFRETLSDVGRSSDRTSEVLQSLDERRAEREEQLTRMLATSRTWMVAGLAVSLGLAVIAVSVAVVSFINGG